MGILWARTGATGCIVLSLLWALESHATLKTFGTLEYSNDSVCPLFHRRCRRVHSNILQR